jgi:hypothetical protein
VALALLGEHRVPADAEELAGSGTDVLAGFVCGRNRGGPGGVQ